MKEIKYLLLLVIAGLGFQSCEESMVEIPKFQVGDKTVIVEEITGVRCVGCPAGTKELVRLDSIYGDNLIVVSMHAAGNFSTPHNPTNDFRNPDIESMAGYIGELEGYPTASIDRFPFTPNSSNFQLGLTSWGGYVNQQLTKEPGMALFMEKTYNEATRNLQIKVTAVPDRNIDNNPRLTVLITQDSIVAPQDQTGFGTIPDYTHRHVLRKILTNFDGNAFPAALTSGTSQEQNFTFALPAEWEAKHCSIVAYVHKNGTSKEVLQAVEKHVL